MPCDQRAERHALGEGGDERAAEEGDVPEELAPPGAPAELEGDAAEDEREQHGDDRRVERRHHHGVGEREDREEPAAAEDQPGLVAVPDRRDGVHREILVRLALDQREEDADPEVEAVEHHVGEHREGDQPGPDEGEVECHRSAPLSARDDGLRPAAGVMPAVRVGPSSVDARPGLGRPAHQPQQVEDAGAEDREVDDDEGDERGRHRRRLDRRDAVGGAQQAVDGPGLAADLGGDPAAQHARRSPPAPSTSAARSSQPVVVEPPLPAPPGRPGAEAEHERSRAPP